MSSFKLAAAVSAIAMMAAFSPAVALAQDADGYGDMRTGNPGTPETGTVTTNQVGETFERIGEAIGSAAEAIADALTEKDPNVRPVPPLIDNRTTAEGMIGKHLVAPNGAKAGKVEDIILDGDGRARLVVTRENTLFGLGGSLMSYTYDTVANTTAGGDMLVPVSGIALSEKTEFSYETTLDPDVRIMPAGWHSLKEVLDGKLVDPAGRELAKIKDVKMESGRPSMLIAGYGEVLNMGGAKLALDFDAPELVHQRDRIDMRLSTYQTEKLQDFKAAQNQ